MRKPEWDIVAHYIQLALDDAISSLKSNWDHDQTMLVRGRISALEEMLRLPDTLTDEDEEADRNPLPVNEDRYGR
jgi:hypothetical protein